MTVRRTSLLLLCALAMAVMFALPSVASATYTTNADCLSCHALVGGTTVSRVDFSAGGTVDYSKCRACHWIDQYTFASGRFTHQHVPGLPSGIGGANCGYCHPGYDGIIANASWSMLAETPEGWFSSATSARGTSAADLHSIHVNGSFAKMPVFSSTCSSCHESAACTACHVAPPAAHAGHTYDSTASTHSVAPVSYKVGAGTPVTTTRVTVDSTYVNTVTCVSAGCHDRTAPSTTGFSSPSCASCHTTKTADHGYASIDHQADNGLTQEPGSTTTCGECHAVDLMTEHAKPTSNGPKDCTTCHPLAAKPFNWDQGCDQCHGILSTDSKHSGEAAKHSGAVVAECTTCHAGTLEAVHALAATPTVGVATYTACKVCHNDTTALAGQDCVSCHFTFGSHYDTGKHSAVTTASEVACGPCHDKDQTVAGMDLKAIHAGIGNGCDVCHRNADPTRIGDIHSHTAECSSCHTTQDVDYHRNFTAKHAPTAASSGCLTPCHPKHSAAGVISDTRIHGGGCATCHNATFVLTGKTAACADCHGSGIGQVPIHTTYATRHVASTVASGECTGCHAADVAQTHTTTYGCNLCHATVAQGGKGECAFCHAPHSGMSMTPLKVAAPAECSNIACHGTSGSKPVASADAHYAANAATHTATPESAQCTLCHSMDLKTDHASVPNACVACHNSAKFAGLAKPWDKSCAACHATKHANMAAGHTLTATPTCSQCHDVSDVTVLHANASKVTAAGATLTSCQVCHVPGGPAPTSANCDTCHTGDGTGFHTTLGAKHTSAQTACSGSNCHAIGDLAPLHSKATTTVAGVAYNGCGVCHRTAADQPKSSDCKTCHAGHGDLTAAHTTTVSAACVACHETPDVRTIHAASGKGACAVCHDNPAVTALPATAECANCHGSLSPADPNHYPSLAHTAVETGCSTCHYLELKPEHLKASVSPTVTCVSCHETKVDAFTTAWNKSCAACHATKHTAQGTKHVSSNAACSGSGCHNIADVSDVHKNVVGGGCTVCHTSPATVPTGKTDCAASGCHASIGTNHHALHDATAAVGTTCQGCHDTFLDDEHAALGYSCATCHASTNAAVKAAIAGHVRDCSACHPAVNGRDKHAAQDTMEFINGNSGGHRVSSTLSFMKSSFNIGGTVYSWTKPADSSFLKTGLTSSAVVGCDDCHSFASTAAGPHGASVKVNLDPAYPTDWATVYLTGGGVSSSSFICAKCHTNVGRMNEVHSLGDHAGSRDGKCVGCHSQVPHGWRLPRLLAYKDDPAPYNSLYLTGLRLKSYTPTTWGSSDCAQSGCSEHSSSMTGRWPSTVQVYGSISGKVTDAANAPIAGASVTCGALSDTTGADGTYSFADLVPGSATVAVSATGAVSQTKTVTVVGNANVIADFKLVEYGTLTGTVTTYGDGALSGATVSITGGGTTTTSATGTYTFGDLLPGTYSVAYSKTGYTSQTLSVVVGDGQTVTQNVALVLIPVPSNLALGKSFSASHTYSSSYAASKAGDDNTSTYWWSGSVGSSYEWLRVDLGSSQSISKVETVWNGSRYATEYRVYTSTDGSNWTQVYSTTYANGGTDSVTFSSRSARYVKVECRHAYSSSNGYQISELRVFK